MIIQKERPTSGQWVAVWRYKEDTWSDTLRFDGDKIEVYLEDSDEFEPYGSVEYIEYYGATYIQVV